MHYFKSIYQFVTVLFIGLVIYLLDLLELADPLTNEFLLFAISLIKSVYFIYITIRGIRQTADTDFNFKEFATFVSVSVSLIILSFAIDFYCLFEIDTDAFTGITGSDNSLPRMIAFLYFSVTTFTTAGLGDIKPISISSQVFVMCELFIAFFYTILIIANITHLRKDLSKENNIS